MLINAQTRHAQDYRKSILGKNDRTIHDMRFMSSEANKW